MNMFKFTCALALSGVTIYYAPEIWNVVLQEPISKGEFGNIIILGFAFILIELFAKVVNGWRHVADIFRLFMVFILGFCIYKLISTIDHIS